jgi:hypothetical protein
VAAGVVATAEAVDAAEIVEIAETAGNTGLPIRKRRLHPSGRR